MVLISKQGLGVLLTIIHNSTIYVIAANHWRLPSIIMQALMGHHGIRSTDFLKIPGLILGLHPVNERRYKVTTSLIG